MDEETLTALKESIAHWERMESGARQNDEEPTAAFCSLCAMFDPGFGRVTGGCEGCPVRDASGDAKCRGTPYGEAYRAFFFGGGERSGDFQKAARAELDFLRSLLPAGEK